MSVENNEELPELPDAAEMRPAAKPAESLPDLPDEAVTVATAPKAPAPKKAARPAPKPPARPPAKLEEAPVAPKQAKPEPKAAPKPKPAPVVKKAPAPKAAPIAKKAPVVKEAAPAAAKEEPAKAPPAAAAAVPKDAPLQEVAAEAPAPAKPPAPGDKPPLRELDKAPQHLRLAAQIVAVSALLPFMGAGDGWTFSLGGKVVALLGAFLWFKQVDHNWGPPLKGVLGTLAGLSLGKKPKADEKPKRKSRRDEGMPQKLEHPFPTALHIVSALVVIGGLVLAFKDGRSNMLGPTGIAETLMVTWAGFTFVHIHAYERWGGFNPLFPLMFLGMLFAGAARALTVLGGDMHLPSVLGGLGVAVGGGLAAYTIVEAMMSAKKEGDLKKAAALEARKAARKTRK